MSFNTDLTGFVKEAESFFTTVKTDLAEVLEVADAELPKVLGVLAVVGGMTAMIPGVDGYVTAAEMAVTFVETLVKTADGVLMPASEAQNIGVSAVPATDAEKRGHAVGMLATSFPSVPTNTHDLHIAVAYAAKHKVGNA